MAGEGVDGCESVLGGGGGGVWGGMAVFCCFACPPAFPLLVVDAAEDDEDATRFVLLLGAGAAVSESMSIPGDEIWLRRLLDRKLRLP